MTKIEYLKDLHERHHKEVDNAISKLIKTRNELQAEYDRLALDTLKEVKKPLYVLGLFSNETVSEIVVIGISDPEMDVDSEPYPMGCVDVKSKGLESNDDWLTVDAGRICILNESGQYEHVITKPFE